MRIAIIGAGFAGLASARTLTQFGHDVTVYEKAPDVGGVWSATRRYPGLRTQNNRDTYALSELPMPRHYPEWPSGEQVQAYLEEYVRRFDLGRCLRLSHEVLSAEPDAANDDRWTLTVLDGPRDERRSEQFDYLVVANGIFSEPKIPDYSGREEFEAAGGRITAACGFRDIEEARAKQVVVVGYGKSSCDVAAAAGGVAAHTTVVARQLLWKMPRRIGGALNFKYLLLTRLGESLFPWIELRGVDKLLHGPGKPIRNGMLAALQAVVTRQLKLERLGLLPEGKLDRIANSTISLATDELYRQCERGTTEIARDAEITRMRAVNGAPCVELSDGRLVRADLVICGTGFRQLVPFFSEQLEARLTDERGNFLLWRHILPLEVRRLAFCGYNSSLYSPLSVEIASLWIAAHLIGEIRLPPLEQRRALMEARLRWMEARTEGRHARGTNIIPFSMHNVDELLGDIGADVPPAARVLEWLLPVRPSAYRCVREKLLARRTALGEDVAPRSTPVTASSTP